MKVANKKMITESLQNGGIIEFDFYSKCYLCDSDYNRLYAIKFNTYLNITKNLKEHHKGTYTMTSSDYYKI